VSARAIETRRDLLSGLERRREEIGLEIFARVRAIGLDEERPDPEYVEGLRLAVEAAIDHTIEAFGRESDRPLEVPHRVLAQARLAARHGVTLDTVLRRYLAGHAVLGDFLVEEAAHLRVSTGELRRILRAAAAETDRMLAAVSTAYVSELVSTPAASREQRRLEIVRRALDGELVDVGNLGYDVDRFHVGIVFGGSQMEEALASLVARRDAVHLHVAGDDGLLWAWIGRNEGLSPREIQAALAAVLPVGPRVGIGEPLFGRTGWRLTHEQARAALFVAERSSEQVVRYADVAVLASAIKDELLTTSLKAIYLDPLEETRGDVGVLRDTLRAYFAADRSASSTAAALGVTRNTVTNRIRAIEERIGHLRPSLAADLSLALRLDELKSTDRTI
jgi:PucR C-terminal helix-turn-helix domain/GGDEF-like domain